MHSIVIFSFKQKTAYEIRISAWSSDVCSSDLPPIGQSSHGTSLRDSLLRLRYSTDPMMLRRSLSKQNEAATRLSTPAPTSGTLIWPSMCRQRSLLSVMMFTKPETGRAHVSTHVTNANIVWPLRIKNKQKNKYTEHL